MKATLKAEWTTAKDFDRSGTYKEELGTTQKTAQKTTQKLSGIQQMIVDCLQNNPSASRKELATQIGGITEDGIKYHLKKLQQKGVLVRIGADKGGHWEIVNKQYLLSQETK